MTGYILYRTAADLMVQVSTNTRNPFATDIQLNPSAARLEYTITLIVPNTFTSCLCRHPRLKRSMVSYLGFTEIYKKIFSHFICTLLCTKLRYPMVHVLCILLLCPCTSMVLKKVKYLIPYFFTMMYISLTFLYY